MTIKTVISLEHVTVCINKLQILQDVTAQYLAGTIYIIEGENNSGKSILLKAIAGIIPIQKGNIIIEGKKVDKSGSNQIGYYTQNMGFRPQLTGRSNLIYLSKINGKTSICAIEEMMRKMGLDPKDTCKFATYSSSKKKLLSIMQSMIDCPPILLLDMPFVGLDKKNKLYVEEYLTMLADQGCCVIITELCADSINIKRRQIQHIHNGTLKVE